MQEMLNVWVQICFGMSCDLRCEGRRDWEVGLRYRVRINNMFTLESIDLFYIYYTSIHLSWYNIITLYHLLTEQYVEAFVQSYELINLRWIVQYKIRCCTYVIWHLLIVLNLTLKKQRIKKRQKLSIRTMSSFW